MGTIKIKYSEIPCLVFAPKLSSCTLYSTPNEKTRVYLFGEVPKV
jgi:hypothetical protein